MCNWKLIHEKTDQLVKVGGVVKDFRGDPAIIANLEGFPKTENSSGRVYVDLMDEDLKQIHGYTQGFYPSVYGLKWVIEI
jgi:hypothetical protein